MPNELDVFDRLSVSKKIPEADTLCDYYAIHAELCNKYSAEIEHIYRLLKELREERIDFLEHKVSDIRKKLEAELIEPEAVNNWIAQLKNDIDRSLNTSEEFLNQFIVSKTAEFERELRERLGKV